MYIPVHSSISIQKWGGRGYTIQDMLSLFTDSSGEILVIPSFNDLVTTLLNYPTEQWFAIHHLQAISKVCPTTRSDHTGYNHLLSCHVTMVSWTAGSLKVSHNLPILHLTVKLICVFVFA